jgi:hypothetical protein
MSEPTPAQRAALTELTQQAQDLGLGYEVLNFRDGLDYARACASPRATAPASGSRTKDAPLIRLTEAEGATTPTED